MQRMIWLWHFPQFYTHVCLSFSVYVFVSFLLVSLFSFLNVGPFKEDIFFEHQKFQQWKIYFRGFLGLNNIHIIIEIIVDDASNIVNLKYCITDDYCNHM